MSAAESLPAIASSGEAGGSTGKFGGLVWRASLGKKLNSLFYRFQRKALLGSRRVKVNCYSFKKIGKEKDMEYIKKMVKSYKE